MDYHETDQHVQTTLNVPWLFCVHVLSDEVVTARTGLPSPPARSGVTGVIVNMQTRMLTGRHGGPRSHPGDDRGSAGPSDSNHPSPARPTGTSGPGRGPGQPGPAGRPRLSRRALAYEPGPDVRVAILAPEHSSNWAQNTVPRLQAK